MKIAEDPRLRDRRVTEWFLLERARKEREGDRPTSPSATKPIVTISRQYCARGHSVAEKVAEWLGPAWHIWDRELIDAVAESAQCRRELVEALDEHAQNWVQDMARSLFNVRFLEAHTYRRHLVHTLLALSQQGHMILVGRGGNFVLPGALNVRLIASLEYRVAVAMEKEHMPREEAIRRLHEVDHERAEFTKSVFDRSIDDADGYDMVLRMDDLGVDVAAGAISAAAHTMFTAV